MEKIINDSCPKCGGTLWICKDGIHRCRYCERNENAKEHAKFYNEIFI